MKTFNPKLTYDETEGWRAELPEIGHPVIYADRENMTWFLNLVMEHIETGEPYVSLQRREALLLQLRETV